MKPSLTVRPVTETTATYYCAAEATAARHAVREARAHMTAVYPPLVVEALPGSLAAQDARYAIIRALSTFVEDAR